MSQMRAMQIAQAAGLFELNRREVQQPGPGQVRVKVQACGICHSDLFTKEGYWPDLKLPRVPGHEIAGVVDAVGGGVLYWKVGQRVGVGWHGGHCGQCDPCRHGDFLACQQEQKIPGITFDGGYEDYVTVDAGALAAIPDGLSAEDAAPLMCAGVTTYNALRNSGARAGDLVAVLGIGGLGHLGVQFAAKMGFETVAIARGKDKGELAKKLGAHHYVDSQTEDPAAALVKLGGAKLVLATVVNGPAMTATLGGLGLNGKFLIVGAPQEALEVQPMFLLAGRRSVAGWSSGTALDSQDTMRFAVLTGIRPMIETYPLEKAEEAYQRMRSGKARFRVVLTTGN